MSIGPAGQLAQLADDADISLIQLAIAFARATPPSPRPRRRLTRPER